MKRKEFIGFYEIKILNQFIVLACFDNPDSFPKFMNNKEHKKERRFINKYLKEVTINEGSGVVYKSDDKKPILLYMDSELTLKELDEMLIHETHHLVGRLADYCNFKNEPEFMAYLQVLLHKEILNIFKKI